MTTPKAANFFYLNHNTDFTVTLDGTQLTLTDVSSGNNQGPPPVETSLEGQEVLILQVQQLQVLKQMTMTMIP